MRDGICRMLTHTHSHAHANTHTHTHAHTYTHSHTHTHSHTLPGILVRGRSGARREQRSSRRQ